MPLDITLDKVLQWLYYLGEQRGITGLYHVLHFTSLVLSPPVSLLRLIWKSTDTIINRILNPLIISIFCG